MCIVHAENLVGRFLIFRFVWLIFLLFGWLNKDGGALLKHGFKAMCTYCFITTVRHLKKSMRLINLGYISLQKKNLPLFDSQRFQLQDWRFVVVCVHWAHKSCDGHTNCTNIMKTRQEIHTTDGFVFDFRHLHNCSVLNSLQTCLISGWRWDSERCLPHLTSPWEFRERAGEVNVSKSLKD